MARDLGGDMIATDSLISDLRALLGEANVLWRAYALALYEYDASSLTRSRPEAVVLPRSTADVSAVMRLCYERGVPCTPRGAGTGLSGGAIACDGGVVLSFARMNRILSIDPDNRCAVVEPGVVNLHLSNAAPGQRGRLGHCGARHGARGAGDAGPGRHRGGRAGLPCRLPDRRRCGAADRGRRGGRGA